MKNKRSFIALLITSIIGASLLSSCTKPCKIEETQAYADMESLWSEFRAKNPYNFQTVGIKQYDDNSYNILLSEPSDRITEEDLLSFFKKYNCCLKTFKQTMGYDGWLKDAIVSFNDIKEEKLPEMTSKLFDLLYGTNYKAFMLNLDTIPNHTAYSSQDLNYQISEEELHTWFIDQKEVLVNVEDLSIETTIADALNDDNVSNGESQLYYSKEAGFVVWVIRRSSHLSTNDFMKKARMFSLDSDLILGAISNNNRTAIIARERSIPVYELPPMRQEMLAILASTPKDELSQSYERYNLLAGKLKGGKDYAPILLSDELWHTEYGNMLNVTDQMLKSWSENGTVEYEGFLDYPKPIDWAFEKGAIRDLEVGELTYNWNTAGAGYIMEGEDGLGIYAVNRTGSLPISYIPGETDEIKENNPVFHAEENAYDFYSNLMNPELVKVVQYASMYQIFINFNIHIPQTTTSYPNSVTTCDLDEKAEALLKKLCALRYDKEQEKMIRTYYEENAKLDEETERELRKELNAEFDKEYKQYKDLWFLVSENSYNADKKLYVDGILEEYLDITGNPDEFLSTLDSIVDIVYDDMDTDVDGKPFLRVVGHYLLNPRTIDLQTIINGDDVSNDMYCQVSAFLINKHIQDLRNYNKIMKVVEPDEAKEAYLKENKAKSLLWQKCPTIVESWSTMDSANWYGGHNLSSRTTPVKINNKLKPGEFYVIRDAKTGGKVIEICAKDKGKVTPSLLRNVERTGMEGKQIFSKPSEVVRSRSQVMAKAETRTARGFNATDHGHIVIARDGNGFVINGKKVLSPDALIEEYARCMDAHEGVPFRTMEFKYVSENEQIAIIDGIQAKLSRSRDFAAIPNSTFDISKMAVTEVGDGTTIVKIPINAQEVKLITASMGSTHAKTSSLWGRIKNAWFEFKIPTEKKQAFINTIKEFFKNPVGTWSRFRLERQLKLNGIEDIQYKECYEMLDKVLALLNHQNNSYYVGFFEEEIA